MIEKTVQKFDLHNREAAARDLAFRLSRPPGERILAVERIRRERDGRWSYGARHRIPTRLWILAAGRTGQVPRGVRELPGSKPAR